MGKVTQRRGLEGADVRRLLADLADVRPVFHSEADFQHALAWQLHELFPQAEVRLETRPLASEAVFLDVFAAVGEQRVAFELKYLVRSLTATVAGEQFRLRSQSAHDVRRHDVVKDIARLERVVLAGAADVGFAVVLSNDSAYWAPGRKAEPIDAAFRLNDGRTLAGQLGWSASAGLGTTVNRDTPIELAGTYRLAWEDFSDIGAPVGGRFRYLLLEVTSPSVPPSPLDSVQWRSSSVAAPITPESALTCRQQVLAAFAALERRHGKDVFTPSEVTAEVLDRGSVLAESTIVTHVTSAMCVNAPPNHTTRYADLERIGRGLYRRVEK